MQNCKWLLLVLSPRGCHSFRRWCGPCRCNPPFLNSWHLNALALSQSTRMSKIKNGVLNKCVALSPSNITNFEQLAAKGLNIFQTFHSKWTTQIHLCTYSTSSFTFVNANACPFQHLYQRLHGSRHQPCLNNQTKNTVKCSHSNSYTLTHSCNSSIINAVFFSK